MLSDLSDEQAGKLFKAMLAFHKGEEIELDPLTKMAFSFFKNQFIRDNEKYIKTCEARAQAGSKGGKQKKQRKNINDRKANIEANIIDNLNRIEKYVSFFASISSVTLFEVLFQNEFRLMHTNISSLSLVSNEKSLIAYHQYLFLVFVVA